MGSLTLRKLRNTDFKEIYSKLLLNVELTRKETEALLEIALVLLNKGDEHAKALGYRTILAHSINTEEYTPLYDIAISDGLFPISKSIESISDYQEKFSSSFINVISSCALEEYREGGIYFTKQQKELSTFFATNNLNTVAVVAPTSYGKSSLVINYCLDNPNINICILVPTKALLTQTRARILKALPEDPNRKLITHPEMYTKGDENFIAVLTQERLLKLLKDDPELSFAAVFVDEAHNMLEKEQRSVLLSKTIAILSKRNSNTAYKFLTPFLMDARNLKVRYANYDISEFKITESIKSERYFFVDTSGDESAAIYDQFLDEYFETTDKNYVSVETLILSEKSRKNIAYLNSPPKIMRLSRSLSRELPPIDSEDIKSACNDIASFLHEDYELLDCLKSGLVYHHGSVPDVIRYYVEDLFSNNQNVTLIVTSSTLLEGVNIPADKIFVIENKKGRRNLSASQFRNLTGRVARFGEIFTGTPRGLSLLSPEIYVVKSSYVSSSANIKKFLRNAAKADKKINDKVSNVLLERTAIDESNQSLKDRADEVLENIEPGITEADRIRYATTLFGKSCYLNNVYEIPVLEIESACTDYLETHENSPIGEVTDLLELINDVFVSNLLMGDETTENLMNIARLSEPATRRFYGMFVTWRMRNASYREMISSFVRHWSDLDAGIDTYVGKWGDIVRDGHIPMWVDMRTKSEKEKINLAIVRIKEEQDFVDNNLIKFVEVFYDMGLLDESFYLKIKYGTDDLTKITLIKNGLSGTLSSLLMSEYAEYVHVDQQENTIDIDRRVLPKMRENKENSVLIFETSLCISSNN